MRPILALLLSLGSLFGQGMPFPGGGLVHAQSGGGAPTFLDFADQNIGGGGSSCTFSNLPVLVGQVVIAISSTTSGGTSITPTINDLNSLGNTFTQVTGSPWANNNATMQFIVWKSTITNAGTLSLYFQDGNSGSFWKSCAAISISASTLDKLAVNNGAGNVSTTSFTSGTTATTSAADELAVGACSSDSDNTWTAGGSATARVTSTATTQASSFIETETKSMTGTFQAAATANASASGVCLILTFQ